MSSHHHNRRIKNQRFATHFDMHQVLPIARLLVFYRVWQKFCQAHVFQVLYAKVLNVGQEVPVQSRGVSWSECLDGNWSPMVCCSITNEQLARCPWANRGCLWVIRSCPWVSTDFTHGLPVHKWLPIGSFCNYPSAAASNPWAASTAEAAHWWSVWVYIWKYLKVCGCILIREENIGVYIITVPCLELYPMSDSEKLVTTILQSFGCVILILVLIATLVLYCVLRWVFAFDQFTCMERLWFGKI